MVLGDWKTEHAKHTAHWKKCKSELAVFNFEETEIDRFLVIRPMLMEHREEIFGSYWGQPFWERNLSDEDQKKLIDYFRSGLAFRMDYFVEENNNWEVIETKRVPFEDHVKRLENKFQEAEHAKKVKSKKNIKITLLLILAFALTILFQFGT